MKMQLRYRKVIAKPNNIEWNAPFFNKGTYDLLFLCMFIFIKMNFNKQY